MWLVQEKNLHNKLKKIGASEVINFTDLINNTNLPLLKEKFSAVIDNIGGDMLQSVYRQVEKKGNVYLVGNVAGEITKLYLLPFILRGIKLIGINAEMLENAERRKIFLKLVDLCKNLKLNQIYEEKN